GSPSGRGGSAPRGGRRPAADRTSAARGKPPRPSTRHRTRRGRSPRRRTRRRWVHQRPGAAASPCPKGSSRPPWLPLDLHARLIPRPPPAVYAAQAPRVDTVLELPGEARRGLLPGVFLAGALQAFEVRRQRFHIDVQLALGGRVCEVGADPVEGPVDVLRA